MGEVTEGMPRTRTRAARAYRRVAQVCVMTVLATFAATAGTTSGFAVATNETTVAVVSSQNPSVFGHGVSFTATVTSTAGTPTGSVQFDVDGLPAGPPVALVAGVATSPTLGSGDGFNFGLHQVDAVYSGDASFITSSDFVQQQVDSDTTSVTVTSTPNPSILGQPVTFDVTVVSASGAVPPGAVYLSVDGVFIDSASTVGGVASMVENGLAAGAHTVDVVFSPDTSDFVDGQVSLVGGLVTSGGLTTTVTSSTPNPSQFNESVTLTAAVAPVAPATAIPTGTVEFFDGVTSLGVATVDGSGNATLAVSTLPVGVHSITSVFTSADLAAFANSTSAAYSHTVDRAVTTASLSALPVAPVNGESATLTAAVTSLGGVPTGTVEFFDGATSLGSAPLVAGSASINTAALSTGAYSLTAVYAGDGNFLASTSSITSLAVGMASTSTVVSPTSPSVFGDPVSFSAQVSAVAPGAGLPTGTVQFYVDNVVASGPVAVDGSGVAQSGAIAGLTGGAHSITAIYSGDSNFATSTAAPVVQSVSPKATSFTITVNGSSSAAIAHGWKATLAESGLPGTPSGTVTFSSPGNANLCTITLPATSCLTSTTLAVGSNDPISATFTDTDGNFTGSTSTNTVALTVNAVKPSAPTGVHATLSSGKVKVLWTAPANDGGSAITSFKVTATPGGKTVTASGSATQATVTGLAAGTYKFKVQATNSVGTGALSFASNPVTIGAPTTPQAGYWMLGQTGHVYAFGDAANHGNTKGTVVAMAARRDGKGYWVVDAVGHVRNFGTANHGGNPALRPGEAVSTISATPSGNGYWLFSDRGRAFAYGDAHFYGDMSSVTLNGPVIASTATPTGHGYYMVGSDGGVFTFGDAKFHGSTGAMHLNKPIVGISPTPDNHGYWLVASDGGVFAFNAPFRGSMGHAKLNKAVNGLVAFGNGYLMVASDGGVFDFSNKPFFGSLAAHPPSAPIIGITAFTTK